MEFIFMMIREIESIGYRDLMSNEAVSKANLMRLLDF